MNKTEQKNFWIAAALLAAFALWTFLVCTVDVRPIGPEGSSVGIATVNGFVHDAVGVHMAWYGLTDWLSLIPLGFVAAFGILGLSQWLRRGCIRRVDPDILALGGFYITTMAAYLLFELLVINYRPVLIDGRLEASYPSSTTMLVMCIIPTAVMQLNRRIQRPWLKRCAACALGAFLVFMVVGRFVSGVHWLSDIVGGGLLSAGLVALYRAVVSLTQEKGNC